jgi:crotonobetainyl-CoA:carnitine CoA-transferase CaiB-like acyl-CoA transferase
VTVLDTALTSLLAQIGVARTSPGGSVSIIGDDPVASGVHRLGGASAVALAAQGAVLAAWWRLRGGGPPQDVSVDIGDAVHALNTGIFLRQNGYLSDPHVLMYSPAMGFHPTRDGRLIFLNTAKPRQRDGILELLNCPHTQAAVRASAANWGAEDLEEACAQRRLAGCMPRSQEEWRSHPQGRYQLARQVVHISRVSDGAPAPVTPGPRPLSGIKVLDVAHILAGPIVSRTLAEQGADVLRITSPLVPDELPLVIDTGFGKRAAFLNLDLGEDRAQLENLIKTADVFIQSYAPGSLARRGFSPERLALLNPRLIYVGVSCYGDGPWTNRVGFDPNAQAVTGISVSEGSLQEPKRVATGLLNDLVTGYLGAAGVLAALIRRAQEGGGYRIDLSLVRTSMWVQDLGLVPAAQRLSGSGPPPRARPPRLLSMQSPFGELTYLAPVTQYSETSAYWSRPPEPLGTSRPVWLPC